MKIEAKQIAVGAAILLAIPAVGLGIGQTRQLITGKSTDEAVGILADEADKAKVELEQKIQEQAAIIEEQKNTIEAQEAKLNELEDEAKDKVTENQAQQIASQEAVKAAEQATKNSQCTENQKKIDEYEEELASWEKKVKEQKSLMDPCIKNNPDGGPNGESPKEYCDKAVGDDIRYAEDQVEKYENKIDKLKEGC